MRNARGFSLLELVVTIIIIVILYVVQAEKQLPPSTDGKSTDGKSTARKSPLPLRVDAEKTSMENVVGAIRSSLSTEVSMRIIKGQGSTLSTLHESNPMRRLGEPPNNYLGELNAPDLDTIEGGHWYFDLKDRTLVYRVNNPKYFKTALPGPARARFVVRLQYDDVNGNGRFDNGVDAIYGLRMEPLEAYSWINR